MFRFFCICLSPDDGTGAGGAAAPAEAGQPAAAGDAPAPAEGAAAEAEPAGAGSPAPQDPDQAQDPAPAAPPAAQAAPGAEPAAAPPAPDIAALTQRAVTAELRAAAALAGVPEAKVAYAARLAQVQGADAPNADLAALAKAAISQVLTDIPELKGSGLNLGGSGDHVRAPEASPEEQARKAFADNL